MDFFRHYAALGDDGLPTPETAWLWKPEEYWTVPNAPEKKSIGGAMLRKIVETESERLPVEDFDLGSRVQLAQEMNHALRTHQGGSYNKRDM